MVVASASDQRIFTLSLPGADTPLRSGHQPNSLADLGKLGAVASAEIFQDRTQRSQYPRVADEEALWPVSRTPAAVHQRIAARESTTRFASVRSASLTKTTSSLASWRRPMPWLSP